MIYAVSDLHGCYDRYRKLLDKLNLGEQDTLYVLGDALDRGPEGFQILSDMASRPQVVGLLGNHEAMALDALPGLLGSLENSPRIHEPERQGKCVPLVLQRWRILFAGLSPAGQGAETGGLGLHGFPAPVPGDEGGGRDFLLVHGGLEHFSPTLR